MLTWRQGRIVDGLNLLLACTFGSLLVMCGNLSAQQTPQRADQTLSLPAGRVLAAIGIKAHEGVGDGTQGTIFQDHRVALGLTLLLAESFYDTGKFRLVEDKQLGQYQLIEELLDLFSRTPLFPASGAELSNLGSRLEADLLTYGRVGYSKISGQRMQIGPFGRHQQKLRVQAEVCLFDISSRQTLCQTGKGSAQQEGVGFVYMFRNDRLEFEKSAAGHATKQAVTAAVQALMASLQFVP
jgi:hypothetical protein